MTQRKRSIRDLSWPPGLKTVATSAVAEEAGIADGVDILLLADDDPLNAANSDFEVSGHDVDVLLDERSNPNA